jgi:hypothetical protein
MDARVESSVFPADSVELCSTGQPRRLSPRELWFFNAQALGHFFVEEAFALAVGLDPFAVNHKLWNGTLAGALDHFVSGSGRAFDIDVSERDVVLLQEALGFAAVRAPEGGINGYLHRHI